MSSETITIAGLTQLDQLELADQFAAGSVTFKEEKLPGAKHGEPLTILLIAAISGPALGVLAAWLLKDRTSDKIHKRVEVTDAKGNKRVETVDVDLRTSKSPRKDVIQALGKVCHVDLAELEKEADK
jgi:hypothetical protein